MKAGGCTTLWGGSFLKVHYPHNEDHFWNNKDKIVDQNTSRYDFTETCEQTIMIDHAGTKNLAHLHQSHPITYNNIKLELL